MASQILSASLLEEHILQISKFVRPTSTADLLALTCITVGSAGYFLKDIAWNKPNPLVRQFFDRPQLANGAATIAKKETRNIAQKLDEHDKHMVIFWGSQSGTAEGIANRLGRECHLRFGLEVLVADLSDYSPETIALISETKFAILILSTYGEGDPSDNTVEFWDWIHKSKEVSLSNLRYAAFGLGNSNYKHYNRVVDVATAVLNNFGAKSIMPVGKADDAEGTTEEDFMAWKVSLFTMFRQNLGLEEIEIKYTPTFTVVEDPSLDIIDIYHGEPSHPSDNVKKAAACSPIRALTVQKSKEIFNSAERNCLHMDLDLSEHPDLHYKTGDHLAVWPMNPEDEVRILLKALGRFNKRDVPITIKSLDPTVKVKIQTPTTTSALVRHYLEICAPVSRETILNLAYFAPTAEAKTYLLNLGQDKDVYTDFLTRNYLTMGRILSLASPGSSWTALPVSYLIESLPHLQPRYYSISSSSVISPHQPSITALVAKTPLLNAPTQSILGLTSNYLLSLSNALPDSNTHTGGLPYQFSGPSERLEGGKIFAHIRKSKFKLPTLASRPLVMIGTGTGLAPFMAFLAERKKLMDIGRPVGEMILFFGCRNRAEDYIYRAELEELEKLFRGKLRLVTAFSRVPGESRVYVQDRIVEHSKAVLGLVEEGANIYICGRANMAKDVERAMSQAMAVRKGWDAAQISSWSRKAKAMRIWQEDVWG